MLKAMRTRAVWMAVGIVLGGSALSYAGVAATSSHGPKNPTPHVSKSAEPNDNESEAPEPSESPNANRPHNHGFYVSQAAQCKDVNDAVNNVHFSAPTNCSTDGSAHGKYVSEVAKSGAGKGAHGHNH